MSTSRHVLITGGSRGIGLSIARLFAQHAHRVTLISRSESSLTAAVAQLHALPSPHTHAYIAGDITSGSQFWNSNTFGPKGNRENLHSNIDVLVNCAGLTQAKLFLRTDGAEIQDVLRVNLEGMMLGTRFLMRQGFLRGSRKGGLEEGSNVSSPVIINVASLLGVSGGHGAVAYAASKAGVLGFTRALAAEYASHGVRVNAIVPGYVATDMTAGLNEEELKKRIPLGRFGTTEEIAEAALFLAKNQYAHNCVLNLDGGLSAV